MSAISSNLSLPYIQANQAQKHITHNEGMRVLDSLTQLSVISAALATPPATPAPGDRYIVAAAAVGDWEDQDLRIAVWDENAWRFFAPQAGWTAWDQNTDAQIAFANGAWTPTAPAAPAPDFNNLDGVGVGTSSDTTNRLAVASDATLLTHAGTGHQVKVNKNASTDTASLLFQTGWSGRAEMGTSGSDDFEIKVSADGSTWNSAMVVDADTGTTQFPEGIITSDLSTTDLIVEDLYLGIGTTDHARLTTDANEDVILSVSPDGSTFHDAMHIDSGSGEVRFPNTASDFGDSDVLTVDYMAAKGVDLVTNGTGLLGNAYNMPSGFMFDPVETPNLPASFSYAGTYPGLKEISEFLPIDPNQTYRLGCYLKQEALNGDWSAYANGDRHKQYIGLLAFDVDKNQIAASQHMRYKAGGVDSMTTLTAPLTPGDTMVSVASAAGWNDTGAAHYLRGIIIFGYKNTLGGEYDHYSRLAKFNLFDTAGVDKTANTITLHSGLPVELGNPDDPNGTWPIGTKIANSSSGGNYKYSLLPGTTLPTSGDWYKATNYMGGIDTSGTNVSYNFPPGTAFAKLFWLPNYSNRSAAYAGYPATGSDHRVWFSGLSVRPDTTARQKLQTNGTVSLKRLNADYDTGTVSLVTAGLDLSLL